MGRKRRRIVAEETAEAREPENETESPSRKKAKKGKHRKRKTKYASPGDEEDVPAVIKPLTLKIRLGNEVVTADTSDLASVVEEEEGINAADVSSNSLKSSSATGHLGLKQNSDDWGGSDDVLSVGEDSYQTTLPDEVPDETEELEGGGDGEEGAEGEEEDDEEEEEEVWLEALETGNVDERGYVPQKKDPSAMTARQRAIFGSKEVELLELPLMKKRVVEDEDSQEMLLKKTERNKKRRMQAIKRREKHKAETVQKLLQKQSRKKEEKKIERTVSGPHIKYVNNYDGITISLTKGLEFPLPTNNKTLPPPSPPVIGCTICSLPKKYSDSVSRLPLCSLKCYNKLKLKQSVSVTT